MNMKHKILYLFIMLCIPVIVLAENATNVRVRQQNKDIIVTYDLTKTSNVQLLVATGNSSFTPLVAVEGAVGKKVHEGENLVIIWHPLEEGDNFIAEDVRFKVEAIGTYEEYALRASKGGKSTMETFVTVDFGYSKAPQISYGLTLGQTYSGYGWYVNARSNFNFNSNTNGLVCAEGGYINGTLPFYSGKTQTSVLVANAGFVMDVLEIAGISDSNRFNTFGFYVGGGYGWRRMLWETIDHQWVEYQPTSHKGFNANFGVLGSVYGLTLKAGINTINFKYLDIEAGIGWMF